MIGPLLRIVFALLSAGGAGALFYYTQFPAAFPGESARAISEHLGINPFHPIRHPLWGLCLQAITEGNSKVWVPANLFSAACCAVSVFFVFLITANIPHNRNTEENLDIERHPKWLGLFCGFAAAGFLTVNLSFWFSATRAYPVTLGIALLLLCVWLVVVSLRREKMWPLYLAAPIFSLGMMEHVTFIFMLPFFVLACIQAVYLRYEKFRMGPLVLIGLLGLTGLAFSVFAGQRLLFHPSADWMYVTDLQDATQKVLAVQFNRLKSAVPQVGWLTLGLTVVLPGVIVLFPKRVSQFGLIWTSMLLHFICSIIAGLILCNGFISSWSMFSIYPLFIAPAVFVAIWAGYLAGYWIVMVRRKRRLASGFEKSLRKFLSWLMVPAFAAAIAAIGWINYQQYLGPRYALYHDIIQELADDFERHKLVLSGSGLEESIRLELHHRGSHPVLLRPGLGGTDSYRRYLQDLFPQQRLKSLAQVSQGALLSEWLRTEPSAPAGFAALQHADLLRNSNLVPVPDGSVFVGQAEAPAPATLFAEQSKRWAEIPAEELRERAEQGGMLAPTFGWYLRHYSKLANNTGVLLHEAGDETLAQKAYLEAYRLHPKNISAMLNLANMESRGALSLEGNASTNWLAKVQSEIAERDREPKIWALSYHYGYVHDPGFYLQRGMAWAMSGKPQVAAREMEKAIEMAQDTRAMRMQLAATYFRAGESRESSATYIQLLRENPKDVRAMLGLARLSALEGDYDKARSLISRLRNLNVSDHQIRIEEAGIEILLGNDKEALDIFKGITRKNPKNMQAWAGIAILSRQLGEDDQYRRAMSRFNNSKQLPVNYQKLQGFLLASEGKYDDARIVFRKVLNRSPGDASVLEQVLRLDMREGRPRDTTRPRVTALLESDPGNAYGNYVLGLMQHLDGRHALAVTAFKTSLETNRSRDTLNALAWSLHELRENEKAQAFAEEAVRMDPKYAPAWDTLGNIYAKLGDKPRGAKCLQKALEIQPQNPYFLFHLAGMYEEMGKTDEARLLMKTLMPNLVRLPSSIHRDVFDLKEKLTEDPEPAGTPGG